MMMSISKNSLYVDDNESQMPHLSLSLDIDGDTVVVVVVVVSGVGVKG